MTEIIIREADAIKLLQEVVDGHEDYVYQKPEGIHSCVYTAPDSSPSCIIGHALAKAGVPVSVLHAIDYGGAVWLNDYDSESDTYLDEPVEELADGSLEDTGIDEGLVQYWLKKNGVGLDPRAAMLFATAQANQDSLLPWGEAVTDALSTVGYR